MQVKTKKRVLNGIRASGKLHLGNYLGSVKGMLALQDDQEFETFYTVVDLHSMTTPFDKEKLSKLAHEAILDFLACGLDPQKSAIFLQSRVADLHCELMFYLSTVISVARLRHLPTYKEKVAQHPNDVTMALLNYPVLMAADILAYKAEKIPVGLDQEPHLEVTREIARKMNSLYNLDFPEPTRYVTPGEYVPSLIGEGKMSKSVQGSYIALTDSFGTIKKRLASTPTDSGKGHKIPQKGSVVSLLKLVELFEGESKRVYYEEQYLSTGIGYKDLKEGLARAIFAELKPIQERRKEFQSSPEKMRQILKAGAEKGRGVASKTVEEVKEKMGLR